MRENHAGVVEKNFRLIASHEVFWKAGVHQLSSAVSSAVTELHSCIPSRLEVYNLAFTLLKELATTNKICRGSAIRLYKRLKVALGNLHFIGCDT